MNEDDHKLIVETETVEAPVSSLLLSSTAGAPSINNNGNSGNNAMHSIKSLSVKDSGNVVAGKETPEHPIVPPSLGTTVANNNVNNVNGDTLPLNNNSSINTAATSLIHEGITSNGTIPGTNINLIDHNPLSPHVTQSSLRNKKSSLLIDSSVNRKSSFKEADELPKHKKNNSSHPEVDANAPTIRKKVEEIANPNNINNNNSSTSTNVDIDRSISYSPHSSTTNTTIPTPLMLPIATNALPGASAPPTSTVSATTGTQANKANEIKPSKNIERPSIPLINSKDILLEDKGRNKSNAHTVSNSNSFNNHNINTNSNNNMTSNKKNDNDERATAQQLASSTSHTDEYNHDSDSLHKPTKADFFAARLASAVGENEISDSEETFIYESAANSTKNAIPPTTIDHQLDQQQQQQQQQHGIAPKISVPVLNNNALLLNRLKNTRHTSLSTIPTAAPSKSISPNNYADTVSNSASNKNNNINNNISALAVSTPSANQSSSFNTNILPTDDLRSINSLNRQNNNNKQVDIQSVKSFQSEPRSPDKRLSLISLAKGNAPPNLSNLMSSTNNNTVRGGNGTGNVGGHTSRKPSVSHSTLRHVSASHAGAARGKNISNNVTKSDNNINNSVNNNRRNLRTTASKIFDANGAPLRRYSGVPDDINLEDFIEQSNGHLMPANNSLTRDEKPKKTLDGANDGKRNNHDLTDVEHRSAIQEEAEDGGVDADDDDMHSMFYFNHMGDLEARPQISDYEEEDGEELDDDINEDNYYNFSYGNRYTGGGNNNTDLNNNSNTNNNRKQKYFESLSSPTNSNFQTHLYANGNGNANTNANANEYSPLKPKKQLPRSQLSYSPHNFYTRKSSWAKFRHCVYFTFVVISLLTVGFILGFLLATNKELQDLNIIIMDNVISSADEVIFDVTVSAFNPGFFAIDIQDVNLDIFAKSSYIKNDDLQITTKEKPSSKETILLGTIYKLETPLNFEGGFFRRNYDVSVSSIKLLDPGSKTDPPDNKSPRLLQQSQDDIAKWKLLIKHEYELILRGNMKYKIPFFRSNKSVAVQSSSDVHPGKDGDDEGDDD